MMRQRQDVFAAIAQGRNPERNDAQAEIQVSAEAAGGNFMAQLAVGRRDDSDIDFARFRRANAQHLAVLEDAQQLGLEIRASFADFVEEQGSIRGALEASGAVADCAGERSLSWPNSSLSTTLSASALQLIARNGPAARVLPSNAASARPAPRCRCRSSPSIRTWSCTRRRDPAESWRPAGGSWAPRR